MKIPKVCASVIEGRLNTPAQDDCVNVYAGLCGVFVDGYLSWDQVCELADYVREHQEVQHG
jgi:hypothetical protein